LQWVNSIRDRAPNIDFEPARRDGPGIAPPTETLVIQVQLVMTPDGGFAAAIGNDLARAVSGGEPRERDAEREAAN